MESTETYKRPSRKLAAALGFFIPPAGMLYVARPGRAAIYLALTIAIGSVNLAFPRREWIAAFLLVSIVCAVQAWGLAREFREIKRPWYSRGPGLVVVIAVFLALTAALRAFLVEPFVFASASMLPSIEPGARLIVKKWGYGNYGTFGIHFARTRIKSEVNRGDIVVFEYPEDTTVPYVMRIIGLPGDSVAYFSKRLWVNDQEAPRTRIADYVSKERLSGSLQYLERLGGREYPILIEAEGPAFIPPAKTFPFEGRCTF